MKEYKIKINGNDYTVAVKDIEDNKASVSVNGLDYEVQIEGTQSKPKAPKIVQQPQSQPVAQMTAPAAVRPAAVAGAGSGVKSPLPGVILEVNVKVGDTVKAGQQVMLLEAMKMENSIESTLDGVVKSVDKGKGDSVLEGEVLITIG